MHVLILNADSAPVSHIPLSTVKWPAAIRALFLGTVSVVEEYDDWEVHSPSTTMRVPAVVMAKRYLHFQRKVSFSDSHVFLRDRYTCQYCHRQFPEHRLTMDHVLPCKYGGKTNWENITTACGPCNFAKGSNRKIVPRKLPYKPTYYELLAIRKEFPLHIPCEKWIPYLDWPEKNLIGKNILQNTSAA
jgi:5-methylcytosine-specific restriction endonuclease McrA